MKDNVKEYRLAYKATKKENRVINDDRDAFDFLKNVVDKETAPIFESFYALYLNNANKTKGFMKVSQGGISQTSVDVRLIIIGALESLSTSIILAHNHPSGKMAPSEADKQMTATIKAAANVLNIEVIDHIILSGDLEQYLSFASEGIL